MLINCIFSPKILLSSVSDNTVFLFHVLCLLLPAFIGVPKGLMAKDEKLQRVLLQDKGLWAGDPQQSFINWKLMKLPG